MNTKETSDYMNNTCITLFQGYSSVSFFKQLLWTLSKQLKISFFCSLTFSKISTPDYGSFLTLKTFSSHQKWLLLPKTPKQKLSPYSDFPDASLKQPLCPYLFSLPDLPLQQSLQQQPTPPLIFLCFLSFVSLSNQPTAKLAPSLQEHALFFLACLPRLSS